MRQRERVRLVVKRDRPSDMDDSALRKTDEERLQWEIDAVRESIHLDWVDLASKDLPPDKRKAIRQHLEMSTKALKDLVERNQSAAQKIKLERFRSLRQSNTSSTPAKPRLDV